MWAVLRLWRDNLTVLGIPAVFPEGMAGVIPVYETEKEANKYADNGRYKVVELKVSSAPGGVQ